MERVYQRAPNTILARHHRACLRPKASLRSEQYTAVATIPFSILKMKAPSPGQKIKADIGILFGDENSSRTDRRVHWVDEQANVVNDVPTEAEFDPARWGEFSFE